MSLLHKLRIYHASLGLLTTTAYLTGETGSLHLWLGYAVAGVIVFRFGWGVVGPRQIGISRLFPRLSEVAEIRWITHPAVSKILLTGIVLSLLTVVATGIALDQPQTGTTATITRALADDDERDRRDDRRDYSRRGGKEDEFLEEAHEAAANALFLIVGLHVLYLFSFKRKMALFMLFLNKGTGASTK